VINFQNTKNFSPDQYIEIAQSYDYEIKRDEYGVPHIIGKTDMDAAFGFGYAQTEDDYENVEFAIKMARGNLSDFDFSLESISTLYSLVTGKGDILSNLSAIKGVELDFLIKFMNVEEIVAENKESIDQNVINYLKGYADGINYWAAKNPNKVDQSIFPVSENDLLVGMVFRMPLFYGFDHYIEELIDLLTAEDQSEIASNLLSHQPLIASIKSHFNPSGSNAFAVSKKRSANNETLLVINSHQPLTGPVAWYEAHIKSDEGLNIMGGTFPGSPFIHVGFNEFLGWGATVNQPDLGDIYELIINPENQNQYLLDGEWLDLKVVKQNFRVKLFGPFSIDYPLDMYFSEHGPVLKDGTKAYALRYVGMKDINQVTEWYRLNKARNFEEWIAALRMQEIASLNLIYADIEDNIYFVHNVKSPIRNENFDWSKVLPGDQSDLIWRDFHPFDSIPQIKNPNSGYLFSANQNPFFVTEREDNLSPDQYRETFGFQTRTTNRAYRAYELFTLDNDITYEEISLIKHDNKFSYNSRQYEFMKKIFNADFSENEKLQDAQRFLKEWNLGTDFENEHAAFGVCILSPEWLAEIKREPQPDPIKIFIDCVDEMYQNFDSLSVPWKEINFLDRGNKMIPIQGGPDVLRAIYAPRSDDGILRAVAGDGLYIYVVWDGNKNQISESIHQYGSATIDKSSSHYDDQMQLYADEKLKNTFFDNY
jgi:penicillin amidase/acyl-homoserine-lactone acylase